LINGRHTMKPGPIPKKNNISSLRTGALNRPQFELPECPKHLNDLAKNEWDRIGKLLERYRLITDIDTAALALYCASYGLWQEAENQLKKISEENGGQSALLINAPSGYPIRNPWLDIANRAKEDTYKYMQQFGLSPAARTRVDVPSVGVLDFGEKDSNYFT